MADIQKLTYPYFTDGSTQLNAANLNPIIQTINDIIDKVNGDTPTQTVATPTISISGSTATISCSTSGATIYYTTNGNTPTTSSTQYSSPISLPDACTIKAIAVKSGMNNSSVASATYNPSATVQPPTIYIRDLAIIMVAESGATIYYTTDGSTPTASSTQYANAFTLPNNATVKAIAVKNGSSSSVASASFTAPQRSTQDVPQVVIEGNKVTMLSNGVGSIRYAFDDSSAYDVYSEPLTLNSATLIKFRTVGGSTIRSGRVNFTGTDNIKVSMRYTSKLVGYIDKASSTESSLVLNTSEDFGRYLKFYKIANSRNYVVDASVVSTNKHGYWGYCNSVPESITGETTLVGKLPSYGSATGYDASFEITSENFQYIAVSGSNDDYKFEFAEIL